MNEIVATLATKPSIKEWGCIREFKRRTRELAESERAGYGEQIVSTLARQLEAEYGRGFSPKNLRHMLRFAEVFEAEEIVYALSRQLSWTHLRGLIYIDDPLKREFYLEMRRSEGWSTRTLQGRLMLRTATLFAVLLSAPLAARADATLSGFVQQNTAFNTAGQNPDGRHYKWLEERAQLKLDATEGAWRLLAKGDFSYDHLGRNEQSELREGYVDYAASDWDLRVGRQVITWGLGDLVFVNDFFPKDHEALFAGRPLEYLKRGVDAAKLGVYPEFASFELVAAPSFRESRIPDANRFRLYDPMPTVTDRETVKPEQGDVGLRAYRDIAGYDAALYLYRGFQRTPSMRPDNMTVPAKITYFYPRLSIYGASLSGRAGAGVLSLEAAYYDSREDRAGNDFAVPNSQTRLLAGYQIQPAEDTSLGFQYYAEHMHGYGAYRATLPAGFPVDKRWSHTVTARLTQLFLHQTLRLSVYASYNAGDHFVNPELRYSFTDKVWSAVGANFFGGKPWGQFGQLARDDNVYLQARYEF